MFPPRFWPSEDDDRRQLIFDMDLWNDLQMEEVMNANYASFEQLVAKSEYYLSKHRWETTAVYSQMAAHFAWRNHAGLFASSRLESILLRLGERLAEERNGYDSNIKSTPSPNHVLHVLTKAYPIGGHTRLVSRWIEQDDDRVHSIILTRQEDDPVPDFLADSVRRSNGKITCLDEDPGGLLPRARRLNRIAGRADLIVLHIHPYDVVPLIAFADRRSGPAVVFMNHADHVFWLGSGVSDLVAHVREGNLNVSLERRGIGRERCVVLPIPLRLPSRTLTRVEAKRALGLDPAGTVLLSVASGYKFKTSGQPSFTSVLLPVLQEHEKAVVVVVGPSDPGEWAEAAERTQGRVMAVGPQEDPSCFFQAADIYLDSFPFGSLTSLLEAGAYGLPLVYSHPYATALSHIRCDDLALSDQDNAEIDQDTYRRRISELISNADLRQRIGESTRQNIINIHTAPKWKNFLNSLYLRAAALTRLTALPRIEKERAVSEEDKALTWMQTVTGFGTELSEIELNHMRLLSASKRYVTWARIRASDQTLPRKFLIPESLGTRNQARLEPFLRPFRHRHRPN